jgi:RimJ/RimL family protein N-acetyltransferase
MWLRDLMRRKSRPASFTFHNRRAVELRLWLEPWAEEFILPPAGRVDLVLTGKFEEPAEAPIELTDEHLVFFAPGGSYVQVLVDGVEQKSGGTSIQVPHSGRLSTRDIVHLVFDGFPEARPSGASADTGSDALHCLESGMAEGDLGLEPLAEAHRDALEAACAEDPDIWPIYAISYDPDHFDASFDALLKRPNGRAFAIVLGGRLVGMSCYLGIEAERGVLEIGNTYYLPAMRGTGLNRRVKDLMIGRAIDCGFRRIEFRVDSRNARSQAAMAKLGAVREGVIRAERITWTGHVRDTILFSILANEWRASDAD